MAKRKQLPGNPQESPESVIKKKYSPLSRWELLELIKQAAQEGWDKLDLSGRSLTELPPEIGRLTELKYLYLGTIWSEEGYQNNLLTRLPLELSRLVNLQILDLTGNHLISLPDFI